MAIAAFVRPLSLDEAVEAVYRAAQDGHSVIDAAREFAHQIDDRDVYELTVRGLAELAHDRLSKGRHKIQQSGADSVPEDDSRAGSVSAPTKARPHAARQVFAMLRDSNYEAADGTRKSLIQFTLADWQHLRSVAAGLAFGWARVRDAADRAISAMEQHGIDVTAKLPDTEKSAIQQRLV